MSTGLIGSIITIAVLVIALILNRIDWRKWALRWVGDNPVKAYIYVKLGRNIKGVEGERFHMAQEGWFYWYQMDKEKYKRIVIISQEYADAAPFKDGRLVIGVQDGQLVANPLGYWDKDETKKVKEGLTEISKLIFSNAVGAALDSVKPNRAKDWMMIGIIVVVVVVGGLFMYNNFMKPKPPALPAQTTNVTAPPGSPATAPVNTNPDIHIVP